MVNLIVLASGEGKRFGENKLFYEIDGTEMYMLLLKKLISLKSFEKRVIIVTKYNKIIEAVKDMPVTAVFNENADEGISSSVRAGVLKCLELSEPLYDIFFVSDMPFMSKETIEGFVLGVLDSDGDMGCVSFGGRMYNPVAFKPKFRSELLKLRGDKGGKQIFNKYKASHFTFEAQNSKEVKDLDYKYEKEVKN